MREILFRGEQKSNGNWVHGDLSYHRDGRVFIRCWDCLESAPAYNAYEVNSETVGQYTGLTDKNGKKIFEGDIVRILGNQYVEDWKNVDYNAMITFIDGGYCAIDGTIEEHGFRQYALARLDFSLEVIGNIHDNPDLLRGD